MSLSAFLHPEIPEAKEIIISERFKEGGKVVPFKIRAITQEENKALIKRYTKEVKTSQGKERRLDTDRYSDAFIVAGTVEPDFSLKEICEAYGTMDPLQVPGRMLLSGEYLKLSTAIMELSGIGEEAAEEELEEAKN